MLSQPTLTFLHSHQFIFFFYLFVLYLAYLSIPIIFKNKKKNNKLKRIIKNKVKKDIKKINWGGGGGMVTFSDAKDTKIHTYQNTDI